MRANARRKEAQSAFLEPAGTSRSGRPLDLIQGVKPIFCVGGSHRERSERKEKEREAQKRRFCARSPREAAQQAKEAAAPKAQSIKGAAKGAAEAAEGEKVIFCP